MNNTEIIMTNLYILGALLAIAFVLLAFLATKGNK